MASDEPVVQRSGSGRGRVRRASIPQAEVPPPPAGPSGTSSSSAALLRNRLAQLDQLDRLASLAPAPPQGSLGAPAKQRPAIASAPLATTLGSAGRTTPARARAPHRADAASRANASGLPRQETRRGRLHPGSRLRHAGRQRSSSAGAGARHAPRAGSAAARASSASAGPGSRAARQPAEERRVEPSEDNCFAFSLAEGLDTKGTEGTWLRALRQKSRAIASAVAARAGLPAGRREDADEGYRVGEDLQVVRLDKDVLLLKIGRKDCFAFSFGCLVCWGCTPAEVAAAKKAVKPYLLKPLAPCDVEEDHLDISTRGGKSPEVPVSSREPPTFERAAVAYALAQSVILGSLEMRIDRSITQTRSIPEDMARTGHVSLSNRRVAQMMGELWKFKNQVNLESDILDSPEVFWKYEIYEPLYNSCRLHLELDRRVEIVNQRFEVLQDLFDVLRKLEARREHRLTWIIIWLCALEAVFSAVRLLWTTDFPVVLDWAWHGLTSANASANATGADMEGANFTAAHHHHEAHKQVLFLPILGPLRWAWKQLL
eukprot:TRINITY_DN35711_c0_g1_i1.p1 TRINITY_DN35711_c0_g1~~TRINITY_DN35711_c0_g1_i1.p1  ORF type:complete len:565 (-),score=89.90 TRINITY_DN35711_c0_g1_i1:58-1689(-)